MPKFVFISTTGRHPFMLSPNARGIRHNRMGRNRTGRDWTAYYMPWDGMGRDGMEWCGV